VQLCIKCAVLKIFTNAPILAATDMQYIILSPVNMSALMAGRAGRSQSWRTLDDDGVPAKRIRHPRKAVQTNLMQQHLYSVMRMLQGCCRSLVDMEDYRELVSSTNSKTNSLSHYL